MSPTETEIAALRAAYRRCFGCGLDNENGLRLDGFTLDDNTVTAPFTPRDEFAGFEGILHGGVIATALDEVSAWSAMLSEEVFVYTARLDIRYRRQANLGSDFVLRGTVLERRGRRLTIEAVPMGDGNAVAVSKGLFVVADDVQSVL
jgi:acyl-coenzyme A thioesterase PaaI-like protein